MVVRAAPFAVYILFLALADPLGKWFAHLQLDVRWLYGIRIGFVLALLLLFARFYHELKWTVARLDAKSWLISIAVGIMVFMLWIMPWPQWAQTQAAAGFSPLREDGNVDVVLAVVRLTGAALVVPVMEELFWRSFLLRWIRQQDFLSVDPAKVGWLAFVIVVALFGIEHSLWLAGMVAGAAYNWLYMTRRNLWAPIVAHALTNGLLGLWVLNTGNWQYW
ncbi:MAG TPA: CAAX prenyl protease-related protein [Methylophilaceae bacterium]|nr:CAAX prenyl protease-related protein [Methylophilaceae bacterium]